MSMPEHRIYPSRTNPLGITDRLRMLRQDLEKLELSQAERVLSADLAEGIGAPR